MGQQHSKEKFLYQQVKKRNIEKIRALRREGAGVEWVDKQGNTPLMVACMDPKLITVAKTLIELGADVNASSPSSRGCTPIRNAALRGLDQTVKLLLTHGPHGAIVTTPISGTNSALHIARRLSFGNVVRAIENHISLFSGLLREAHHPVEGIDPPWYLSGKIWAVVMYAYGSGQSGSKLELRIYYSAQDAHPREVISLWEAKLEEPNFHHTEPSVVIVAKASKTKHIFYPTSSGDKQQLQRFFSACQGIQQGIHPPQPNSSPTSVPENPPPLTSEDEDRELAMALSASLQYNVDPNISSSSVFEAGSSSSNPAETTSSPSTETQSTPTIPEGTEDDQMNYASIFFGEHDAPTNVSLIDMSTATTTDSKPAKTGAVTDDVGGSTSCIICFDAPREGACIPCGHMVGCVSCLNEIKTRKLGCPVCRTNIDGVIRIYDV
ncbi:hypothetical protein MKX01_032286 [Papaver californicum]|nr:hypothetical protein MKX01_032286 [Papaver californicum]